MSDPVEAQLLAYNARDVDAFMACFAEDCCVDDADGARLMTGHTEMRERYRAMFAASPELHCTITHRIRIGDHVIDDEAITGRLGQPANEVRHAVAIYKIRDGKICHVRFYRDAGRWS
jgi:hypothetical protein